MIIYFCQEGDNIKIGRTSDLKKRKSTLQTSNAKPLKIKAIIKNVPSSFENHIHQICEKFHIRGEWYNKEALSHLLKNPWFKKNIDFTNIV